jgi:hypothetical protein
MVQAFKDGLQNTCKQQKNKNYQIWNSLSKYLQNPEKNGPGSVVKTCSGWFGRLHVYNLHKLA